MKQVTKEDFYKLLESYPNRLSTGVTTICEPPIQHYHDSTLRSVGVISSADYFFDTEVARIVLDWLGPNGDVDNGSTYWKYFLNEKTFELVV